MSHTKPFSFFMANKPIWMTEEAVRTIYKSNPNVDENPLELYDRLAKTAASYYPKGIGNITREGLRAAFTYALHAGWLSPATPVAYNFGSKGKGLCVSCYVSKPENSIKGIFEAATEAALLSKGGGGLGINLSEIIGSSPVTDWMQLYDTVAKTVNQGGVRRGHAAMHLRADHPDIEAALNSIDVLSGDITQKIKNKLGVIVDRAWLKKAALIGTSERKVWARILELRQQYGFPYIQFQDNCWEQDPEVYKARDMKSGSYNLCQEVSMYHDSEHTVVCVLSSLNLDKYSEWHDWVSDEGLNVPELGILFLDAVNEEFIQKASQMPGLEKAVRFATKSRALGLGVLGWHSLLQQRMIPFESDEAADLNETIFRDINASAYRASALLAQEFGESDWTKGSGRRNTHLMAVAPTTSNSVLCNAGSPGIEPVIGNYFVMKAAKTSRERKNKYLVKLLDFYGRNSGSVWEQIRLDNGSVANLDFLSTFEKEVFKTAFEIDPYAILEQAAVRQKYICQGQSLNLFIKADEDAGYINELYYYAEKIGIKGLYYQRSESLQQRLNQQSDIDFVYLRTRPDCPYCVQAKELLTSKGIKYLEEIKPEGRVPEIFINGEKLSNGYESLQKRFFDTDIVIEEDCVACSG